MRVGDPDYEIMALMFVYCPCRKCTEKYDRILLPIEELWESNRYLKTVRDNPDHFLADLKFVRQA